MRIDDIITDVVLVSSSELQWFSDNIDRSHDEEILSNDVTSLELIRELLQEVFALLETTNRTDDLIALHELIRELNRKTTVLLSISKDCISDN